MRHQFILFFIFALTLNINAQQSNYDQIWNNPSLVSRINENIEKYRKGDAIIEVKDKDGNPVSNASIEVHQKTHEFLFGSNIFVLGQLSKTELNQKYENAFTNLFNFATLPFYWRGLEPQEGKPRFEEESERIWRRPPPDQLLKWCKSHNITAKGHALMYNRNTLMPDWTEKNDPDMFLKQAEKHMSEIADRYQDDIVIWDVVNEERHRTRHPETGHKVPDDYLVWCFKVAGSLFPENVKLIYNDDTQNHPNPDEYAGYVNRIIDEGLRIDGMGLQFHLFNLDARNKFLDGSIYPPDQLLNAYDQLEKIGLPLYITEITVPGAGENGATIQAEIIEDLYRLWFSVKNMAGITYWNLGDGTAYGGKDTTTEGMGGENKAMAGLLDETMNPKPAYQVLDKLINDEWKTKASLKSNREGKANFRGFYGRYEIKIISDGKTQVCEINLGKGEKKPFVLTFE
jgi:GH35 family endo-1,4-beta-xylanase